MPVGLLRSSAGAIEELRGCALVDPAFGGENPAVLAWRSAAALSLAELAAIGVRPRPDVLLAQAT